MIQTERSFFLQLPWYKRVIVSNDHGIVLSTMQNVAKWYSLN
jgi:hypothetical protein